VICLWRQAAVATALTARAFVLFIRDRGHENAEMFIGGGSQLLLRESVHCWTRFLRPTTNSDRMKTGRV
jgi:hypothetical protein